MISLESSDVNNPESGAGKGNSALVSQGILSEKSQKLSKTNQVNSYKKALNSVNSSNLSKSVRGELFKPEDVPGPGAYEMKNDHSGPAFSFSGKIKSKIGDSPGPGAYSPKLAPVNSRGVIASRSARKEFIQIQDTPGPGKYDSYSSLKDAPS